MAARIWTLLANLCWLASCLPGWAAFVRATRNVRRAQESLLARIIRANRTTEFGRARHMETFDSMPLSDYEDCAGFIDSIKAGRDHVLTSEPIERLHPTSGSTAATKLIPYTRSLRRQFRAAIDPWIASMYMSFPSLLMGRQYWSISPSTRPHVNSTSKIRIGFADDTEYLGLIQRRLARALFAVPPEIARVADHDAFEYLTLLFLCREANLRLISIWHPSFMTTLLKALPRHFPSILRDIESGTIDRDLKIEGALRKTLSSCLSPDPARARLLARIDLTSPDYAQALWPKLRVVSCWTDGNSEPWLSELAALLPHATVQGKGLTATEGIVTIPLGKTGQKVCAVRSHYFEFLDATGKSCKAWEIQAGNEYSIVLTTGGGLYRYRLHDMVRVTGFYNQAPCLDFLGRDNLISDIVGEKLNGRHVEACIDAIEHELGTRFDFAMLAPHVEDGHARYVLFVQPAPGSIMDDGRIAEIMEAGLRTNYQYDHARGLSQLEHVRVFWIAGNASEIYRRRLIGRGMKAGDIKVEKLSRDHTWLAEFRS